MDYLYNILSPRSVDTPTLLAEMEKLTYEDFKDMQKEWLKNVKTDWQVYGHIEQEEAVSLVKDCESLIVDQKSEVEDVKNYVLLKDKSVSEYFIPHPSDTNKNSTAICYFQGKGSSEDMKAYALNYFLFSTMRHHAFQTLRTQEQLGYIVFCQNVHVNTILGGSILVHSPKKDPDYLVHRINTFLESEKERIQNLSDEDFEKNKKSLITKKKVKDVNLRQATHRDWEEIYDQLYEFSRREKQIEALESITKEELIDYFNEIIFENCRRLNIKVICKAHQENPDLEAREMNQKWYEDQGYTVNQIDPNDIAKFQKEQNFLEVRS